MRFRYPQLNRESPQAAKLIGWWPAAAAVPSGPAFDVMGIGGNGAANGDATRTHDAIRGAHFTFDGTGDYYAVTSRAPIDPTTRDFSAAFWAKTSTGDKRVVGKFASSLGWGCYFYTTGGTKVNWFAYGSGGTSIDSAFTWSPLLDGTWHHHCGVYSWSGSTLTITIYVDGYQLTSYSGTVNSLSNSGDFWIGGYLSTSSMFNGQLDDVRFYDRILTPDLVYQIWSPKTRWDLYDLPVRRSAYISAATVRGPQPMVVRPRFPHHLTNF